MCEYGIIDVNWLGGRGEVCVLGLVRFSFVFDAFLSFLGCASGFGGFDCVARRGYV
jgi:hypothetical protein